MNSNNNLVKLIYKTAILVLVLLVLDLLISFVLERSLKKESTGQYAYRRAIIEKADIVIFGASKSETNYVPHIINQETGLSSCIVGLTAGTFLIQYPQLITILEEYTPKLLVFELIGDDLGYRLLSYAKGGVIDRMLIHDDNKEVKQLLKELDKHYEIKSLLKSYRYNSVFRWHIVRVLEGKAGLLDSDLGHISKEKNVLYDFDALDAHNDAKKDSLDFLKRSITIENAFLKMLDIIEERQIPAIFVHSPNYGNLGNEIEPEITGTRVDPHLIKIIEDRGFGFFDMGDVFKEFDYNNREYYADAFHMTEEGAEIYSRLFGKFVKELLASDD